MNNNKNSRIEPEIEVKTYIERLKYALDHNATIRFLPFRMVDIKRDICYSNGETLRDLFPNENPISALRRELKSLTTEEYIETVKDLRFPNNDEMRVFGKTYHNSKDVYIKIRVELLGQDGKSTTFVMSFHYSEFPFSKKDFPYKK